MTASWLASANQMRARGPKFPPDATPVTTLPIYLDLGLACAGLHTAGLDYNCINGNKLTNIFVIIINNVIITIANTPQTVVRCTVSAKPKDISDGRKITAVASQRRCDIA